jgi:hypothetical protein
MKKIIADFPHEAIPKHENISYNDDGNNTNGFSRGVTAITAVTNNDTAKGLSYTDNTILPNKFYRLYEKSVDGGAIIAQIKEIKEINGIC